MFQILLAALFVVSSSHATMESSSFCEDDCNSVKHCEALHQLHLKKRDIHFGVAKKLKVTADENKTIGEPEDIQRFDIAVNNGVEEDKCAMKFERRKLEIEHGCSISSVAGCVNAANSVAKVSGTPKKEQEPDPRCHDYKSCAALAKSLSASANEKFKQARDLYKSSNLADIKKAKELENNAMALKSDAQLRLNDAKKAVGAK